MMRCWEWEGAKNTHGYGSVSIGGSVRGVHCVAYEEIVGPIPTGLELDHLCCNRACYNPEHLEPVTHKENVRRGKGHGSETHCPQGHPYSGSNVITTRLSRRGGEINRRCRVCKNSQNRAYRRRTANV